MRSKPKFNKQKCLNCMYHTTQISGAYPAKRSDGKIIKVACDYGCITGHTCLIDTSEGVYDMRGTEYDNCRLYKEGVRNGN